MNNIPAVDAALMEDARHIAQGAGKLTLRWFRSQTLDVEEKGDGSPVTIADKAAERAIREEIESKYPASSIIGEEEGTRECDSTLTWFIDPIDGTKGFVRGVPLYATLLAVNDEYGPAVGVIDIPALGETVWAGRGLGAFCDQGVACVSDASSLAGAFITTSAINRWSDSLIMTLKARGVQLRGWGDGYGFLLAATGRVEAMLDIFPEAGVHPWDFAPCPVIFSEAGGRSSALDGSSSIFTPSMLASNGLLHNELLSIIADSGDATK